MTTKKVVKSGGRGAKPGERRGGRKKGVPNKVTVELKGAARAYTVEALDTLVEVMSTGSDAARVSAAKEILDRGYGKATTIIAGDPDGEPVKLTRIELVPLTGDDG